MLLTRDCTWGLVVRILFALAFLVAGNLTSPLIAADDDGGKPARTSVLGRLVNSLLGASETKERVPVVQEIEHDTQPGPVATDSEVTHKQAGEIKVTGNRSGSQLRTFCVNNEGKIFGVVGPDRPYGDVRLTGNSDKAEIRVFDSEGKELDLWPVGFAAQAIAVAPNGTVFVAGNGKIAKFDPTGKQLHQADAPHVARFLKKTDKLKEEAEASLEESKEQYETQAKQLQEQLDPLKEELAELEAKEESERQTPENRRRIRALTSSIKNQKAQNDAQLQYYKQRSERSVEKVVQELTGRLKTVNALAVSNQDVFIASGITRGFGYGIWRTSHDFEGSEQIATGLSGCCGQMDIRCCEDGVYVAENSRKRVVHFDRDGKKLAQWGEGDRNGSTGAKFGGCCNPMNLCFGTDGEIFTAESEGFVKRFTKEGSFLGIVGRAKVSGGCKNVAIGISPDGEKVYFYDREKSRIVVLNKKGTAAEKPDAKPAS